MSGSNFKIAYVPWWNPRPLAKRSGKGFEFVGYVWRQRARLVKNMNYGWMAFIDDQTEEKLRTCPACDRPIEAGQGELAVAAPTPDALIQRYDPSQTDLGKMVGHKFGRFILYQQYVAEVRELERERDEEGKFREETANQLAIVTQRARKAEAELAEAQAENARLREELTNAYHAAIDAARKKP